MSLSDNIDAQSAGAMFYRADLHIHSYGGSHDVKDVTMTPENIVATAVNESIFLISIADHNDISNVKQAIDIGQRSDVIVIPGVELSTAQGHLLCYLPDYPRLMKFFAGLDIVDVGLPTSRCQQSILECLAAVNAQGGFGILAHVDVASGFEHDNPGGSPHKVDVICHPALVGIELKHATSDIHYSPADNQAERVQMGRQRIERLGLGSRQYLARVMNSDSHALTSLGRNASNDKRVTRYKMDKPSFAALKIALEDADARVRIEDLIPKAVPHVVGIAMEGGFLDKQVIQFSRNLNCIIGGRGTGKSTTFEGVRCLIGTDEESGKVVDSEVWPDVVHFIWQDKAGQRHLLARHKDQSLENLDDVDGGPCSFEIDCFGQGDAARISIEAQKNPLALLNYLDKFVDFGTYLEEEESARDELLELQTAIEKAEQQVALIPQYQRQLQTTQSALAAMQKPEVKTLIELQRHLATERELRTQIVAKLKHLKNSADITTQASAADEITGLANPSSLTLGRKEFEVIVTEVNVFKTLVVGAKQKIATGASNLEAVVAGQTAAWKAKDSEAQGRIDIKKRELEALRITFDMSYITKLANDEASHKATLKNLEAWRADLTESQRKRQAALARRRSARDRIAMLRGSFGRIASTTLREALSDLQVSLKYVDNAYSPEASEQIVAAMGWRTNQQVRASYLVEDLTVPSLLEAIQNDDIGPLTALMTKDGTQAFDSAEARVVLERLSAPTVRFGLERVALYDVPKLQVSKQVADGAGGRRTVRREFYKLSLGQQQSILLALMLSANSDKPLIIDQPEDNLDGEFIYSTLVPVLRRAKERRQVIIVTHNANVAVLGDAEQIIVLKANNDRAEIVSRGSIDRSETRDAACAILEGAKEAFMRRAKMYGFEV
ncbi:MULTISPECIES: TrlF family AAA-like ATPase [Alcaligenaceae]|uniref:AAA family ATPase n=2 Tax=Alcaligenaceae TaxID=506 RepID=A0A853F8M5_9BURK|nr:MULTISPECIES: AAA family ATPase [Alcaligenaceae]MCI2808874.1 AAA family ATPase [Eoetvoesiella caeni]NYT36337.1 AAA family ATPase [Allopusillimonas soli]NYT55625.1 AAA family ATPase [Eoetvoesiella caeni]RBP40183.1 putative AbiEii toxin of type IV toxin-antitoxin system [Eoetvoesiella caeni]TEA76656.1 PHP-like protein [Allopusillimonas soli]